MKTKILLTILLFFGFTTAYNMEFPGYIEAQLLNKTTKAYRIRLIKYEYCGHTSPTSYQAAVNYTNGCPAATLTLNQIGASQPTYPTCQGTLTSCESPTFTYKGLAKYTYEAVINFAPNCGIATIGVSSCCIDNTSFFNMFSNNTATQTFTYLKINTSLDDGNNSVGYVDDYFPFVGTTAKFKQNVLGSEVDGDSVAYSIETPYNTASFSSYIYKTGYNQAKPLSMIEPSMQLDNSTGELSFTPTTPNEGTMYCIKATEYRKLQGAAGKDSMVYAGENIKFYFVRTLSHTNNQIQFDGLIPGSNNTGTIVSPTLLKACKQQISFDIMATGISGTSDSISFIPMKFPNGVNYSFTRKKSSNMLYDTILVKINYNAISSLNTYDELFFKFEYCKSGIKIGSLNKVRIEYLNPGAINTQQLYHCIGGVKPSIPIDKNKIYVWFPSFGITFNEDSSRYVFNHTVDTVNFLMSSGTNICPDITSYRTNIVPLSSYLKSPAINPIQIGYGKIVQLAIILSGGQSYNWIPNHFLYSSYNNTPSNSVNNVYASPIDSTKYIVNFSSSIGCIQKDSFLIQVNSVKLLYNVFLDANNNNIKDPTESFYEDGEAAVQSSTDTFLIQQPGNQLIKVGINGNFKVRFNPKNNLLTAVVIDSSFTGVNWNDTKTVNIAVKQINNIGELEITHRNTAPINAAQTNSAYIISCMNTGNTHVTSYTVKFIKKSNQTVTGAIPFYSAISGDTLIWNLTGLNAHAKYEIRLNVNNTGTLNPSDTISTTSMIQSALAESNLSNNIYSYKEIIADSNSLFYKSESHLGILKDFEYRNQDYLNYTIYFKNKTNAPLKSVTIIDTLLDINFDLSTFEVVSSSHPQQTAVYKGVMRSLFDNINLSNSSVNNANTGYIHYRIKPKTGLNMGSILPNNAFIFFDNVYQSNTNTHLTTLTETQENPMMKVSDTFCNEDASVLFCPVISDPDAGNTLGITVVSAPKNGTVTMVGACYRYTPEKDFFGRDSITLKVCDNTGLCDEKKIQLTVFPVNDTPKLNAANFIVIRKQKKSFTPTFTDPDTGQIFTRFICKAPLYGTLAAINATDFEYTSSASYLGPDTVCIRVCDQNNACAQALFIFNNIREPDTPKITSAIFNGFEDQTIQCCPILIDQNPGDILTLSIESAPAFGSVTVINNCINYSPFKDKNGTESFLIKVCDQTGLCSSKLMQINVAEVPDTPTIASGKTDVTESVSKLICPVLSDVDANDVLKLTIMENPVKGYCNIENSCIRYNPYAGFTGNDQFRVVVTDKFNLKANALMQINILKTSGINPVTVQSIIAYPNPFKETIQISTENDFNIKQLLILDVTGRIMYQTANSSNQAKLNIPTHEMPSGAYLLKIADAKGIWWHQSLIKE